MQGNLQQNRESFTLASILSRRSGLPHCFFSTSGVMVNENAVKVAFQKRFPANRILAFDHCFAGRSLTFSQVTDKPSFREGLPLNQPVDYVPFFDYKNPDESIQNSVKTLSQIIARYPGAHAIMLYELVQGEAGFYTAPKQFFEPLMKLCKENKIAVFADEVQSFARTEALFAYQMLALQEYIDIAGIGKLSQVCATLFSDEYKPRPGLLSQTFTGSTAAILTCIKILEMLKDEIYYGSKGRMAEIHKRFAKHLMRINSDDPALLQGPFGIGGMIAFTPLDGSHKTAIEVSKALFDKGVLSFIAGMNPTRIRFLVPALVIKDEEIDHVMEIVEKVLQELKGNV
jgi:acetylornithine/N-succinyldiaminopimelate aminotransferase